METVGEGNSERKLSSPLQQARAGSLTPGFEKTNSELILVKLCHQAFCDGECKQSFLIEDKLPTKESNCLIRQHYQFCSY